MIIHPYVEISSGRDTVTAIQLHYTYKKKVQIKKRPILNPITNIKKMSH